MLHGNSRERTSDNSVVFSTSNCGGVCLFSQNKTTIFAKCIVRVSTSVTSLLLAARTSTVAIASRKETMITSTHNLPLSSLREKVLHFL